MENMFAVIVSLAMIQLAMCSSNNDTISPPPSEFFPDVKSNLTKIVWAHAVNNHTELAKALSSGDIMMLEADVVLGKVNGTNSAYQVPIMAHPPANESDLSLEDFLETFIRQSNGSKGIKLDFKSDEVFDLSKNFLSKYRSNLKFPVFLNADILPGPVNATTTPINAQTFLKGANETLPESTLSVGWTTSYGKGLNITDGQYTLEQVQKMLDVLKENKVTQPITYPVRAGLVANDIESIKKLLENSTSSTTLTIWSSEDDDVDVSQLSKLIQDVGLAKIYLDVPEKLKSQLNLTNASTVANLGASLAFILILLTLL
ncbi:protein FAM151B isoform X2 [Linepithema humile]|uniref:protein FAM151B isoform X2 n=1 Tax=Linepithema humile TaxID=83485 RepID=UPI0006236248|nr:PREDICTED: protein FAM151B isoform X2 [Linepithema humile]